MSDIVICVDGISKKYRIGAKQEKHRTLRDALSKITSAPFRKSNGREAETIWALKDISFNVRRGEVVGIVGRNGAGKSTLLKILSKITEPTTGYVDIEGRVGSLLEVGTGFHHELTGRENIFLSGAILGMKRAEVQSQFDAIVAFAEIEKFVDMPVKHYSSGMYLRLAFAVAAHLEPEILLIDEVLAVGDAAFQKKCLGKTADVAKEGRTVLFVSHNMAAVTQLCQRAVWLDNGKVKQVGSSEEVVRNYLSDGNRQVAERRWTNPADAPGDDRIRLLSVCVVQEGRTTSIIDINIATRVEIIFEVLRNVHNLISGIIVHNSMNVCLFDSCDWRPNQLAPGIYRKHVEIPAQLLAEDRIDVLVQLVFFDPEVKSVVLPNALTIDAIDSDHPLSVRGLYKGPWSGVVRIRLDWSEPTRLGDISNRNAYVA